MEPLQASVTEVTDTGSQLVQGASYGVDTQTLEADIDAINKQWTDLSHDVSHNYILLYLHPVVFHSRLTRLYYD